MKGTKGFFRKFFVLTKFGDLGPKWTKNRVFGLLWKIELKVLDGNTLKRSTLLLSTILQKSTLKIPVLEKRGQKCAIIGPNTLFSDRSNIYTFI